MRSRQEWRVHADVAWAVDRLLLGKEAGKLRLGSRCWYSLG